ncbi:hypothetical protein ACOMHN_051282 [Nucella lapillus]
MTITSLSFGDEHKSTTPYFLPAPPSQPEVGKEGAMESEVVVVVRRGRHKAAAAVKSWCCLGGFRGLLDAGTGPDVLLDLWGSWRSVRC